MRSVAALVLLLLLVVHLGAETPVVVGRLGDIEVTASELRESLAGLQAQQQSPLANDAAALGQYLRALLVQKQILSQSSEEKWDQDPAVIARLVRARETALAESYLEAKSVSPPTYPSDAELKEAYEKNKEKLQTPRSYQLAHVFLREAEDADAAVRGAVRSRLDEIGKRLAAKGADFAVIARGVSEDPASAAEGGRIGWLAEGQIHPAIREKLPGLQAGRVSAPIRLPDGWHFIKVLDIREARIPALEEVRESLSARLRAEHSLSLRQQYLAELLKNHPPAINEIELMKIPSNP